MNDDQASPHLNIGDVVDGRYELLEEIGEGGFATVYRARQRIIDRIIALKVLHIIPNPKRARAFAERFAYEARLAAQIQHPNVVTIHDFGFAGLMKQPYIAMEMLSGYGLDEELKRNGALEARRAFKLIRRALDAIRVGHRLGVVHKDLKPPNLFLCAPGTEHDEHLKILDFGVARLATEATSHTATGEVIGTPQYLAPEYILEQLVTPAFDVYQMGLILVEMLTGRKVVADANPYSCAMKHADGKIEVPDPLWHGALGPVLRRALARDHSKRFQDAGELLDALEGIDADRVKRDLERGYSGSTNLADDQKDPKSSTAPLRPDEPWLDRMADVAFASEPDADRDAPATDVMPTVDSDAIDDEQRTGERTEVHDTNAVARLLAKTVDGGGSSADGAPPPWAADLQRAMASPGGAQRSAEVAAAVERGAAAFAADATPGRLDPHKVEENFAAARRETEEKAISMSDELDAAEVSTDDVQAVEVAREVHGAVVPRVHAAETRIADREDVRQSGRHSEEEIDLAELARARVRDSQRNLESVSETRDDPEDEIHKPTLAYVPQDEVERVHARLEASSSRSTSWMLVVALVAILVALGVGVYVLYVQS